MDSLRHIHISALKHIKHNFFFSGSKKGGFLNNELRIASYELRATIYYTSCELHFTYELRVTIYCTSYQLHSRYELRVITYCTNYGLLFTYELRVTICCTSYELFFFVLVFTFFLFFFFFNVVHKMQTIFTTNKIKRNNYNKT